MAYNSSGGSRRKSGGNSQSRSKQRQEYGYNNGRRNVSGNSRRSSRRPGKRRSPAADVFGFILAVILVVVAFFIVYFVYERISGISSGNEGDDATVVQTEADSSKDNIEQEEDLSDVEGIQHLPEGIRYLKEDGNYAEKEWIIDSGYLYYFDETGFAVSGRMSEEGELFEFDDSGHAVSIKYDPDYSADESEVIDGYNSLVRSKTLWTYLSGDKTLGTFNAIMYKKTTEARSYVLGGDDNPQFSSPYSMQISGNTIYFLPFSDSDKLTDEEKKINKTLYRMKPGDEYREIIAQNVDGYKVVDNTVFYMTGSKIYSTDKAVKDETKTKYTSDSISLDDYSFVSESDGLYLCDSDGEPVTGAAGSKRVGSFTYNINEEGKILGVREKTSVTTGGWTYYTETDSSTGKQVSRILRKNSEGEIQVVSTDFSGMTGNMFYDYSSGNLVAEYSPNGDNFQLAVINIKGGGDIDKVDSISLSSVNADLLALVDGKAICGIKSGTEGSSEDYSLVQADLSDRTPIAVGVISENIIVGDTQGNSDTDVTEIPSSTLSPVDPSEHGDSASGTSESDISADSGSGQVRPAENGSHTGDGNQGNSNSNGSVSQSPGNVIVGSAP